MNAGPDGWALEQFLRTFQALILHSSQECEFTLLKMAALDLAFKQLHKVAEPACQCSETDRFQTLNRLKRLEKTR